MLGLLRRLLYLLRFRRHEDDLADEIASHQAMMADDFERDGLAADEARAAAHRALGNDALNRNRARDVWIWPWLQDLAQDVRFAGRRLIKDRRFTVASVAALALGIGANTTAFTFLNGGVLRPLPLDNPHELVALRMADTRNRPLGVSYADARDWKAAARSFSHLIVSFDFTMNLSDEGIPAERYYGSYVSADVFNMVRRQPLLGRAFTADDDRLEAPRVALIAHTVWTRRYASDPGIIGRVVKINDAPVTIIGVMPERFHFPAASEIWQPGALTMGPPATLDQRRGVRNILGQSLARLAPGVTVELAQAEMDAITARLQTDYPDTNTGLSVKLERLTDFYRRGFGQMLMLLMAAVALVLLVACVNVASLQLSRAPERSREIAIRASLGGSRWRIVRQLLIESVLIAGVSGAAGLVLAFYGVRLFATALSEGAEGPQPFWIDWSINGTVYLFLVIVCVAAAALFGLAPALHVSKTNVVEVLKEGGRSASSGVRARRWTGALMVAELAMTLVLMGTAALLARSFVAVYQSGRVLNTTNMVTMRLSLSGNRYATPEGIKQFFRQIDERLAANPLMGTVTIASDVPLLTMTNSQRQLAIRDRPLANGEAAPMTAYLYIGPRYFETLKLPLVRGREFTGHDGLPGQQAVIVNQRFASMFFPDTDPIGRQVQLTNAAAPQAPKPWFTIVGIAQTVPQFMSRDAPEPVAYVPVQGEPAPHRLMSIIARTETDAATAIATMREEVRRLDPSLAGYSTRTLTQLASMASWPHRVFGIMFGLLAAIALAVSTLGLYAVTAHSVAQRTPEIGIRMALGARSTQVLWMFVKRTLLQVSVGLALGLVGAAVAGRQLDQLLVKTAPTDPLALSMVGALLVLVTLTASVLSARQATRVDPVVALRYD